MSSPVRFEDHSEPVHFITTWLGVYRAATPGVRSGNDATVRLDPDNEVQPDGLLLLDPAVGGRARISEDDYLEGPPELIVEVAASSASHDLHEKRRAYRRNEVQEYLVWQVYDRRLDWFQLSEGEYVPLEPDADGIIRSQVFPGLNLDVAALLEGDLAQVLAELQKGLESPEHVAFVERLAARSSNPG